jgi:hypothetical protein
MSGAPHVTERRPLTLLQLAVAATVAIVPVLVGVLLVVASMRQPDRARTAIGEERHISVRHLAALRTFESGVVRRTDVRVPVPDAHALLDGIPECTAQWDGRPGLVARIRNAIAPKANTLSRADRMALDLEAIDQALLRFSSAENQRVIARVGLDGARWIDAVRMALRTPVEAAGFPGRQFVVQCADVAAAVATMARGNGRILPALAWRGTEVTRTVARWRTDQLVHVGAREVSRTNPWTGIAGCIYLGQDRDGAPTHFAGGLRGQDDQLCARDEMTGRAQDATSRVVALAGEPTATLQPDDPRWQVPPSLGVLLQPLATLQRPAGRLYRAYTESSDDADAGSAPSAHGPNRLELGGIPIDVGYSIDLTIEPAVQALAQRTAACYTGRHDVCALLGMRRKEDADGTLGGRMIEKAMVRMAAVAIVDVATGRIEALAGALSPCTRQEYDGPGRESTCDRRMPYPIRYRPDALDNAAIFHDAMPASTIKPIMASAFLSDTSVGPRWLATELTAIARGPATLPAAHTLRNELMRSDSARFLDRMFCADQGFGPCARPWAVQSFASAFGWNGGCAAASLDCGKRDVLFGRRVDDARQAEGSLPAFMATYGRLMVEPPGARLDGSFLLRKPARLDDARVRRCAAGPDGRRFSDDDWEKCSGGMVVDVVAEGWGQGHARATALGSAGMMARLAAAANGEREVRAPHLVARVRGTGPIEQATLGPPLLPPTAGVAEPVPLSRDAAAVILSGLTFGPRAGTSRSACEQVLDARTCAAIDWIAGKTGTPTFPNDYRSLDELARLCAPGVAKTREETLACGSLRPYKWYVAAYRTDRKDPRWTKAIAVLTERNWYAATGRIQSAGDRGPNPAAEIALQVATRHARMLSGSGE